MPAGEGKVFTMRLTMGCLMALTGFCMYSNFKLWRSSNKATTSSAALKSVPEEQLLISDDRLGNPKKAQV